MQKSATNRAGPNVVRRVCGLAIGLSPLALLAASIAVAITAAQRPLFAGSGFMIAAVIIAVVNFSLSFIRPHLFRIRHGSLDGYRHVSGVPGAGTILVILGSLFGFGALGTAIIGLMAMTVDTGGSLWFLISTWRDSSFWDS